MRAANYLVGINHRKNKMGFDQTAGSSIVIHFTRHGIEHKTIRWSSDVTLIDDLRSVGILEAIKKQYAEVDALVTDITRVEAMGVSIM